ncbi:hypothetical protein BIV60_10205 [Bacillus sp. MUM 116]|uniref:hypothetical protein n=1 Tax=Bacillus sp. MUM 116 TaxID=1678002 RepID=UPI0008F5AF4A|nr:hypothetical protein [Bacillus sp. MUM 116]OIK15099.1 hypothetical protein BIV60_10205 [Bacillus sp. MUM 116]
MKVNQKTAFFNEKEVQYTHIENGSKAVCFMFSGSGYTYDKPLMHLASPPHSLPIYMLKVSIY